MATISFNVKKCQDKIEQRVSRVQKLLDAQVMKDSNYFVPVDKHQLERSVLNSKLGSGVLVWDAEYAKKQYYHFVKKSKDQNPNASTKWFERAKERSMKTWEKIANAEYRR